MEGHLPFGTKQGNTSKHNRFTYLRRRNAVERGSTCRLNPTWYLVSQHFGLRGKQENSVRLAPMNTSSLHLQRMKMAARMSRLSTHLSAKMRISPIKLQGRMVIPRMVVSSGEKWGKVQNMDPWSMDPLRGPGPWTGSMDPFHGPGPWIPYFYYP